MLIYEIKECLRVEDLIKEVEGRRRRKETAITSSALSPTVSHFFSIGHGNKSGSEVCRWARDR